MDSKKKKSVKFSSSASGTLPLGESGEKGGKITIGSRGSDLALWQANFVLRELKKINIRAEIKIIKTQGDIAQNLSWDKLEGKGFFTKEIEDALLKKEIDLAVHSHKDLPTDPVPGLIIAAVSEREDPSELLLINKNAVDKNELFSLKKGALVGTSSARRKSQMLAWRPDVKLQDLRGNVPTRIKKLRDTNYDAILLANAGVTRLKINLSEFHSEILDPNEFIPAPAQGVLALQIRNPSPALPKREREKDEWLLKVLQKLNSKDAQEIIYIERKILNLFDGGCQLPLGVYCQNVENFKGESVYSVRIAKAEQWNSFPKYFYFETKKTVGFSEKIVQQIKRVIKPSERHCIFISRNEKPNDFFKRCLEASNYKVFLNALIETKQVAFSKFEKTDWIFFASKNAVKFGPPPTPPKGRRAWRVGVIGKSTAEEARKRGWRIDFIGDSNDTKSTAKKFAVLVGNERVLFPRAKESLRTLQKHLKKRQVVDLVVYETIRKNNSQLPIANCQLLVFTSPSNVESFFEKNKVTAKQKVIAMGNATASALKKYKVKSIMQPASFDDLGLVQAVFGL